MDCNIDRNQKADLLEYIKKKYKQPQAIDINFTRYRSALIVPGALKDKDKKEK